MAGAQKCCFMAPSCCLLEHCVYSQASKRSLRLTLLGRYGLSVETPEGEDTAFHYVFETCKSDQENMTVQVDKLSGSEGIPSWVRATKFNNGFGKFEGPTFSFSYLFDVMAYIVKWQINGNKVTFANKF